MKPGHLQRQPGWWVLLASPGLGGGSRGITELTHPLSVQSPLSSSLPQRQPLARLRGSREPVVLSCELSRLVPWSSEP